jgi:hypothetical protein
MVSMREGDAKTQERSPAKTIRERYRTTAAVHVEMHTELCREMWAISFVCMQQWPPFIYAGAILLLRFTGLPPKP